MNKLDGGIGQQTSREVWQHFSMHIDELPIELDAFDVLGAGKFGGPQIISAADAYD